MRRAVAVLLVATGGLLLAGQGWMAAKAALAEVLIERAFVRHLDDGAAHPPWSWADTHPIARLDVPRLGVRRHVLAGATGASMAFGAGHVDGTAAPGEPGNCALAGHRDGGFAFLQSLRVGDELRLLTRSGTRHYRVRRLDVHSMWDAAVLAPAGEHRLTLITCYPFDGLFGGPLRYVVTADGPPAVASTCAGTGARRAGFR